MEKERGSLAALPTYFGGINMLDRLTIKKANSWLGYKTSKAVSHLLEALYKTDKLFHDRLKDVESIIAVLAKVIFNDLKALKPGETIHETDLEILDKILQNFLAVIYDKIYKITMTLNNHQLAIKMIAQYTRKFYQLIVQIVILLKHI